MRIDAQGKYLQTILEKACRTLPEEHANCEGHDHIIDQGFRDMSKMSDFGSLVNLPSPEELHVNGEKSQSGFQQTRN